MPNKNVCAQCGRSAQGQKTFCRICKKEHPGGRDDDDNGPSPGVELSEPATPVTSGVNTELTPVGAEA